MPRPRRFAKSLLLVTSFLATGALRAQAADPHGETPTLAVVDFEVTPGGWTLPPPQVGATVADLLLDQLVAAAPYRVLDGLWLQPDGARQNRGRGFESLRQAAEASSVDYLVLGSVTRFSAETMRRSLGGGGFGAPLVGGYGRQTNELVVSLSARIVDVRTGEVVTTGIGNGTARRRRITLGLLGFLHLPGAAAFSSGGTASRDAQLDEALRSAVAATARSLIAAGARLSR